ncbi:MAG: DJ-1/PfpI family protein [candidate division WOR-3 bacterium]
MCGNIYLLLLMAFHLVAALPVAVFVPQQLFRDDEFETVVKVIERAKIQVVTVAVDTSVAQGIDGLLVKPQRKLREMAPDDFAALVLIDGSGASVYWQDSVLQRICREFVAAGRLVAAIELAPITLAYAGVLNGKSATVFPDHFSIKILKENGCRHRFGSVVKDGDIITAAKAEHALPFARTVVRVLKERGW